MTPRFWPTQLGKCCRDVEKGLGEEMNSLDLALVLALPSLRSEYRCPVGSWFMNLELWSEVQAEDVNLEAISLQIVCNVKMKEFL